MCIPDCKSNQTADLRSLKGNRPESMSNTRSTRSFTCVFSISPRKRVGINLLGKLLRQGVDGDARWRDARKGKEIAARDPIEWACNRIAECDVEVEPGKTRLVKCVNLDQRRPGAAAAANPRPVPEPSGVAGFQAPRGKACGVLYGPIIMSVLGQRSRQRLVDTCAPQTNRRLGGQRGPPHQAVLQGIVQPGRDAPG